MPSFRFYGFTNPIPGREEEYNTWYNETHLADLLKIPGIVSAQRFKLCDDQRAPGPHPYKYLAVYYCEADSVGSVISELTARSGTDKMPITDAMDSERMMLFFEPITDVIHSDE